MKEMLLFSITLSSVIPGFAQKANDFMDVEHPAIALVNDFLVAAISGDPDKIASFLTEDFKFYHGTSATQHDPGIGKWRFVKLVYCHQQEPGCFAIEPFPDVYPERVQYLADYRKDEVWVQTWNVHKGLNRITGLRLNTATPRLYKVSKDNKIRIIINYTRVHRKHPIDS